MQMTRILPLIAAAWLVVSACVSPAPAAWLPDFLLPTPTLTGTPTHTATATFTPTPSATLIPSATPTPTLTRTRTASRLPSVALGEVVEVPGGGFLFRPPSGYKVSSGGDFMGLTSPGGETFILLMGGPSTLGPQSPEELMEDLLTDIFEENAVGFTNLGNHPLTVHGKEGLASDISGIFKGAATRGQMVVVLSDANYIFFAIAMTDLSHDRKLWDREGQRVFTALLGSVRFTTVVGKCPVASDKTYGYSQANPIQVGGGWANGPARERAYLDNLRGEKGEVLSYERRGSIPADDGETILDIYEVRGIKTEVTLYLDEYHYAELQAPAGFHCESPFPLGDPEKNLGGSEG